MNWMLTIGALASGAVGSVGIGGYVPATCRVPDPLEAVQAPKVAPVPGSCSQAAAVSTQSETDESGATITRITVTPR